MQSFTTPVANAHSTCPKCGSSIDGSTKSCGSCGSVSLPVF
jgi:ribosomal protein L37E